MKSLDEKLKELKRKQNKILERKKTLLAEKSKRKLKYAERVIKVLGRIELSLLDDKSLSKYFDKARKAERKELLKCLPEIKPDLKAPLDALSQGKN